MTKLVLNLLIKEVLEELDHKKRDIIISRGWISQSDVIKLYRCSKAASKYDLLKLLQNSSVYIPPLPVVEGPSVEFKENLEKLKLRLQESEYQSMIASSSIPIYDPLAESPLQIAKEMKHQLTTIVNIAISVFSVGYAIWYWTGSSMHINNAYRVLLCLFFSILVLVAEVVVFNGYLTKIDEAKVTERKKEEVKKVVQSVTFKSKRTPAKLK